LAEPTGVLVSYRPEDSGNVAGRLADRLNERFQVLMDIDAAGPGMDSSETRGAGGQADVVLAVIGPRWTKLVDESGQRRLDDPNDRVAAEIVHALERGVPVIPVLVDGARMPTRAELPEALAGLASRQAVTLRNESFTSDSSHLLAAIERRIPATRREPESPAAQLAGWEAQANVAAQEGRWAETAELLERIKAANPSYGDVTRKLPVALRNRRIGELQQQIRAEANAGNWQTILNLGSELNALDPAHDDPDGLVTKARQHLAEARRRHLASLFDQAVEAEAAGRWLEAADHWQQINALDPRNADIANRLRAARHRLNTLGAGQTAAIGGAVPGQTGSGPGGAATGSQTRDAPEVPAPVVGAPQAQQKKRALRLIMIAAAALVLIAVIVAAMMLINRGDAATTTRGPSTSPAGSPEATPTPTPTPSSAEMAELLNHIPPDIRQTCQNYEVADRTLKSGVLAAVSCFPPGTGPANAWYFLYESEAATKKAFADFVTGGYKPGDCTSKQEMMRTVSTDGGRTQPAGVLKCYLGRGTNDTTFAWTHEDLHILAFADDPDMTFPKMKAWWMDAGPFRNP